MEDDIWDNLGIIDLDLLDSIETANWEDDLAKADLGNMIDRWNVSRKMNERYQ